MAEEASAVAAASTLLRPALAERRASEAEAAEAVIRKAGTGSAGDSNA
jgi:hypothetical protein